MKLPLIIIIFALQSLSAFSMDAPDPSKSSAPETDKKKIDMDHYRFQNHLMRTWTAILQRTIFDRNEELYSALIDGVTSIDLSFDLMGWCRHRQQPLSEQAGADFIDDITHYLENYPIRINAWGKDHAFNLQTWDNQVIGRFVDFLKRYYISLDEQSLKVEIARLKSMTKNKTIQAHLDYLLELYEVRKNINY